MIKSYTILTLTALLSVVASASLYKLEKDKKFDKLSNSSKQLLFGVIFGVLSILGTELGMSVRGVVLNVRDVAPICAGLIFGAPAGIISGLIGGIERYFAVYWGAGTYTRLACTIATIFAGFISAFLRKYMFDDKKPAWFFGLMIGAITEVFHMLVVFIIHINEPKQAFWVVQACTIPMIILTSSGVALSMLAVSFIGREYRASDHTNIKISQDFQRWLLICVLGAFVITTIFTYAFVTNVSISDAENILSISLRDVESHILEVSDEHILDITKTLAQDLSFIPPKVRNKDALVSLCNKYEVSEINIIDENGIIITSSNPDFLGFDMASGEQSAEFLVINKENTPFYVQKYQSLSYDASISRKYAAAALKEGGFVQAGYDAESFHKDIASIVPSSSRNRHVGEEGFIVICDSNMEIISDFDKDKEAAKPLFYNAAKDHEEKQGFLLSLDNTDYLCMYTSVEGYLVYALRPNSEVIFQRDMSVYLTLFMEVMVFSVLFIAVYILINMLIVKNIAKVNDYLGQITGGNLDVLVDVNSNQEFASLSSDINSTVSTLKRYIAEAAARIDQELEYAKDIQYSSLPHVFPPFPDRTEFDIWAGMNTAKEVGGDFYDFYFVGENKLAFLIADVSGKGIPAALFMMRAKTMIKNMASTGMNVEDVFTEVNNSLCENNEADMFVTAWMGVLDLSTYVVRFANAGHNPPVIRHKNADASFDFHKAKKNLVLGGMEGIRYAVNEVTLAPGDIIFLYTDGVTEATDSNNELYGDDRLLECLNSIVDPDTASPMDICKEVKTGVDAFVGDAPQFDDITMVCLRVR